MTSVWRIGLITLCVLVPSTSRAQRIPTVADVRARLHSTNPAEVAWAAFDAATFQMREVAPDLIAVLELPPTSDTGTRDYLVAAVLDALIQAGTSTSVAGPAVAFPETLERYYSRWPVQTLILFGREGDERGPILQRLLASASGQEWFALANQLSSSRAPVPGFAATVLRNVRLSLEIEVVDPGTGLGVGVGGGSGGCSAIGMRRAPNGFPPHVVYSFESGNVPGAIVMSRGPRTVYYSRRIASREVSEAANNGDGPTTDDRLAYLNALIRTRYYSFRPLLRARTSVSIAWTNERAFEYQAALERQTIAGEYDRILDMLSEIGYLTSEEATGLPLDLTVDVRDLRASRDQALPEINAWAH